MNKYLQNYKINIAAFIALMLIFVTFLGYKKQYLYEDEVLSYTTSNNHTGGYTKFTNGEWTTKEELFQQVSVSPDETFDFKNAIYNQALDAHPPLYAVILHGVCSLFPGTYSKWYGLSVNFLAFVFFILAFFWQNIIIFDNDKKKALYITVLYSLSIAVITRVLYIRMYMLLVVFTTLCMNIHLKKIKEKNENEKIDFRFSILLLITTFFGCISHYYYYIFAFFTSAFYCIWLLFRKRFKEIIQYIITYIVAFVFVIIANSSVFKILFNSEASVLSEGRGIELSSIRLRVGTAVQIMNDQMFGGLLKPILLVVLIYCIWLIYSKKLNSKTIAEIDITYYLICFTTACYFITVTLIAPYICDRHFFVIFGNVFILAITILLSISDEIFKSAKLGHIILFVFGVLPLVLQMKGGITDLDTPLRRSIASENGNLPCIFTDYIYKEENIFDLMEYDKVFYYDYESELVDDEIINADELVVYVAEADEPEEYMKVLQKYNHKISQYERLYVGSYAMVYKFF